MASLKIKRNDMVRVIVGKDKDKEGKVLAVDARKRRVLVEGVNEITKHVKPSAGNHQGGIVKKEAPIHISNVMYLHNGKPTRIGFTFKDGQKMRFAKSTGDIIDVVTTSKKKKGGSDE